MKTIRFLFVPVLLAALVLSACSGNAQPATTAAPAETTPEAVTESVPETTEGPSGPELSEMAMDNFLKKIDEGNYTIDAESFMKASVFSRDLVTFEYVDEAYKDFVAMSVNDETFQAFLNDGELTDLAFVSEGQAIEAASSKLLNCWMDEEVSEGNIYNLFYNSTEEPLTFVSYEEAVKRSLMSFVGYGENALRLMQEVYLIMDDVDPAVVHLKAAVDEDLVARISYDDIDVVVTFGDAQDNPAAESWMSDPVYPEARTEWTEADLFVFNSVFLPGYGDKIMPFPTFASYAFVLDGENFVMTDEVAMRDSHATELDVLHYVENLLNDGYNQATETAEDGSKKTVYRKMLREEYKCYASIEFEFDDGVSIIAKKYYDFPTYEGPDEVNEVIVNRGYLPLPADENAAILKARDTANALTESWLYFYDYDLNLYVDVDYTDYDKVITYLEQYGQALLDSGFHTVMADDEIDFYESADGFYSFRYHFDENNALQLLFKAERYISAEEANAYLTGEGYPALDITDPISARDLRKFEKVQFGADYKAYFTLGLSFDSVDEAGSFFDSYESALTDAGYGRVSPDTVGGNKPIAIYNEDTGMLVSVDFIENGDGSALINYDFIVR